MIRVCLFRLQMAGSWNSWRLISKQPPPYARGASSRTDFVRNMKKWGLADQADPMESLESLLNLKGNNSMDSLLNGDYTAETTEDYGEEICNLPYPGNRQGRETEKLRSPRSDKRPGSFTEGFHEDLSGSGTNLSLVQ